MAELYAKNNKLNRTDLDLALLRRVAGFPDGSDEAILALSRPPYYTACPNPFLSDFITQQARPYDPAQDNYCREPYLADVTSQERHPVFAAHPYHTKVPPEVIRKLISHFCEEGGVVFDGFCGSGMTGVAALETGRSALLCDLSSVATFISGVNTTYFGATELKAALGEVIAAVEGRLGWLYHTQDESGQPGRLNYAVWSDLFTCPKCSHEFSFFPHAVIQHRGKVQTRKKFPCPACRASLSVRKIGRVLTPQGKKKALVWVSRTYGRHKSESLPSAYDLALASQIEQLPVSSWHPNEVIDPVGYSAKLAQLEAKAISEVTAFLSHRNLIIFSSLLAEIRLQVSPEIQNACIYALTGIFTVVSERQGYFGGGGGMSGNLYMPIVRMERNIFDCLRRKLNRLTKAEERKQQYYSSGKAKAIVTTQSSHSLPLIPTNSIDYIYTDPPFGANIIYSEMNLLLESWLQVKTSQKAEIVINEARGIDLADYQAMLGAALSEFYRILKPDRWLTLEFHNTKAVIWNVVQQVLEAVGFVVAHVGLLDKGSSTILQDIRDGAVYQDLLISAYKPTSQLKHLAALNPDPTETVWDFVQDYLAKLPAPAQSADLEERRGYRLYNRMLALHLRQGRAISLSATEFYAGLNRHFVEIEGAYFLPEK